MNRFTSTTAAASPSPTWPCVGECHGCPHRGACHEREQQRLQWRLELVPACTGGRCHTPAAPAAELVLARDILLMTACASGHHVCRMELLVLSSLDDDNMAMACRSPRLSCLPPLLLRERTHTQSPRITAWLSSMGRELWTCPPRGLGFELSVGAISDGVGGQPCRGGTRGAAGAAAP